METWLQYNVQVAGTLTGGKVYAPSFFFFFATTQAITITLSLHPFDLYIKAVQKYFPQIISHVPLHFSFAATVLTCNTL